MKGEVRRKFFSNQIIVTLVTQGLPSSFLSLLLRDFTIVLSRNASLREERCVMRQKRLGERLQS